MWFPNVAHYLKTAVVENVCVHKPPAQPVLHCTHPRKQADGGFRQESTPAKPARPIRRPLPQQPPPSSSKPVKAGPATVLLPDSHNHQSLPKVAPDPASQPVNSRQKRVDSL